MSKIYIKQIFADKMTIDDVPQKWYDTVKEYFDEILENGEITLSEYKRYNGDADDDSK